jgi:signal transduction histidine kinase
LKDKSSIEAELEALKNANAFKDELLSIIGHDLRSPLTTIKGILDLFEKGLLSENEQSAALKELKERVDSSLHTLDNLLGWASQKAYGNILDMKTKDERLNVYYLVEKAADFTRHHAQKKSILIINNVPADMYVIADMEQTSFVLRNLIGNAIKFSYQNKDVIIEAAYVNQMIAVSVIDRGIGISQERLKTLFQITHRSSGTGTSDEKGTGLGLIFCKEFVENNGGKIWAESTKERTVFSFTAQAYV